MEDGNITDSQISASSRNTWSCSPPLARLNLQSASPLVGGWTASSSDSHPWLQVDFLTHTKVTGIATQGLSSSAAFVDKFTISYSNNNQDFEQYEEFGSIKVTSYRQEHKHNIDSYHNNTIFKRPLQN